MVDLFSLGLAHALIALAVWRLVQRPDLDEDPEAPPAAPTAPTPTAAPQREMRTRG